MSTIESFLTDLSADLAIMREARRQADQHEAADFTVFRYLKLDENLLSDIIADLLDPRGPHGQGALFLQRFLDTARLQLQGPLDEARVRREDTTTFLSRPRRIDFTIEVGSFGIGAENKPWAGDQEEQVADYLRHMRKRYGDEKVFFVYLSGDGKDPPTLDAAERTRLEQRGRFRTVPFAGGRSVSEWLRSCYMDCKAERVRTFLGDLIGYVDEHFGPGAQARGAWTMETDIVMNHALRDEESLRTYFDTVAAFDAVAGRIVTDFTEVLVERLRQELGAAWQVMSDAPWEKVWIRKADWPVGPTAQESLRVALAHDQALPCVVYFTARQDGKAHDAKAQRIAAALDADCGPGKRNGEWWPYWYRYEDCLTDWRSTNVLLKLWQKGEAVDHFANRLVRMAKAVDSAFR